MAERTSEYPTDLVRSLVSAIDAGIEAEDGVRVIAIPAKPPKGRNWSFTDGLAARWQRKVLVIPPDQVRRCCDRLDEFAAALANLANHVDDIALADKVSAASNWSNLLWDSNTNASDVYNDVRDSLAKLNQFKMNMIRKRPISGQDT